MNITDNPINKNHYQSVATAKNKMLQQDCSGINDLSKDVFVSFTSSTDNRKPIASMVGDFKHQIQILFPDIDGTIRDFNGSIPESATKALDNFKNSGIPVVLSTGRTYTEGKDMFKKLGLAPSYMITQQGAEIIDTDGRIIHQNKLDLNITKKILNSFQEYKTKFQNPDIKMVLYIDGIAYSTEKFTLPYNWEEIKQVESFDKLLDKNTTPTKILLYEPEGDNNNSEKINCLISFMNQKLPKTYNAGRSAKHYCEITSPEATKGSGIRVVLNQLGIDFCNAAAIGDAENDLEMLETVKAGNGLTIAMGNGLESVKDMAEYETLDVDKDGFALALNTILKNNNSLALI